ncbi:MAG: hypothetical protein IPM29_20890 [Planctomycetes bacterium]|nr:hypothetical protein [Planctomycetota bacterium]
MTKNLFGVLYQGPGDDDDDDVQDEPHAAVRLPAAPKPATGRPEALPGESWDDALVRLRGHFPDAREGVLFCVHKLLQDRDIMVRDFKAEADMRGIKLSGRSYHSAKVLLGMAAPPTPRRRKVEAVVETDDGFDVELEDEGEAEAIAPQPATRRQRRSTAEARPGSVEDALRAAISQIEDAARADAERLRDAIREAIDVLQRALDDTE